MTTTERRYDIDWLRVIAIGLLLIYHIAIIFQPWAMLIGFIRSNQSLEYLWKIMSIINVWRIPLLFYISGIGLFFALKKRHWKQLLFERSKRILLPLLFGVIAITPLHMFIFQTYYNRPLYYYPHLGHLWFLGNIFIYVLLLLPLFVYLQKNINNRLLDVSKQIMKHPMGPLSISIFFVLEALVIKPQLFELYANTWHGFFLGFIAFFFGYVLMLCGNIFWQTALKWRWLYIGFACLLFVVRLSIFNLNPPGYLLAIESNSWILGGFGFAYKYLNKPSPLLRYLSLATYPVYIIHMFALYLSALVILPLQIPPLYKFIIIILFTTGICFFIYEFVIKRVKYLSLLFGQSWKNKSVKL